MTSRTLAVLPLLLVSATAVSGQKPPASGEAISVHPEARTAIDHLWSPYCPGMMLDVCTSSGGAMMRDSIQRMADGGMSAEAIVESMLAEYGEQWRAQPLRSGTGLWAWLLPPIVIVVGLGAVALVLARRRGITQRLTEAPKVAPDDQARLREALKELEELEEPVF
jgi:cytochrome c-type biogenesis protein CcmH/NrfF